MWQERKKRFAPLPPDWKRLIQVLCPFYNRLPEPDRRELEDRSRVFLAEKHFEGCDELAITDEIRVGVAATACLLLLHRGLVGYPGLRTILVYPSSYFAPTTQPLGAGVLEESWQARAGESWQAGVVVLAWDEVCRGARHPETGNVVLHEFAHQLDYEDGGDANGIPALGNGDSFVTRRRRHAAWVAVMRAEYEQLRAAVTAGQPGFLRAYGATNPAEFFAVATEVFFGDPVELQRQHPALYAELQWFYRQDPAQWLR
jgi:Mlc titration factor MtfA (ptsG expression regulator)